MNYKILIRILLIIGMSFPGMLPYCYSQADLLRKEIEKIMKYENPVDYSIVPGILVGVLDGDSTFRFSFGEKINRDGVFEMGSVTKPVVAWLTNKALITLQTDRDARVCQFLPDSVCAETWEPVRYKHLLEHKAGLVRLAPGMGEIESDVQDPYKDYTIDLLASDLETIHPSVGKHSYSHLGYAMTHWLFEKVGGLSDFTEKQLAQPYLMKDTKWEVSEEILAKGHGLDGRVQPPWNTNALTPAIGLKSSLNDMITFVRLLFFEYERNQKSQKASSLKKEMKALNKAGAYKVVDGWFVVNSGKHLVYYHNGRTGGHHVSIAFTPNLKKGVIVISNGAMGSNDLSLLILRMVNQAYNKQKRLN